MQSCMLRPSSSLSTGVVSNAGMMLWRSLPIQSLGFDLAYTRNESCHQSAYLRFSIIIKYNCCFNLVSFFGAFGITFE